MIEKLQESHKVFNSTNEVIDDIILKLHSTPEGCDSGKFDYSLNNRVVKGLSLRLKDNYSSSNLLDEFNNPSYTKLRITRK